MVTLTTYVASLLDRGFCTMWQTAGTLRYLKHINNNEPDN